MSPDAGHLVAEVDLRVEVTDHVGRRTAGRLVGTAQRLRLDVTDPAVVVAASGRGATHGLAARLAAAGVRAELHGPRGRVAVIDPRRTSRAGALLTGSPHVTLDRAGWALPVRASLPPRAAAVLAAVASVVAVGGLVSARALRRRRPAPPGRARPARRARPRRSPWG
ncbi:MAG: hypothetical protein K0S40_2307 [Actinomycetospora sp.]|nr:hypothetical protein [Actinomycetospora sp.]